jgi:hypothetical protein
MGITGDASTPCLLKAYFLAQLRILRRTTETTIARKGNECVGLPGKIGDISKTKRTVSMLLLVYYIFLYLLPAFTGPLAEQQTEGLIFREDWKEIPAETPVTPAHLTNPDLELHLYGAAKAQLKKSNHPEIPNDPFYIWSGTCEGNWAMALALKNGSVMDLTGNGRVIWKSRQSGFRHLRVLVQLTDGSWLVSEEGSSESADWQVSTFVLEKIGWRKLNMERITEGAKVADPDFSAVQKIGMSDLMAGGGSPASSRLDWLEVHGIVRQ